MSAWNITSSISMSTRLVFAQSYYSFTCMFLFACFIPGRRNTTFGTFEASRACCMFHYCVVVLFWLSSLIKSRTPFWYAVISTCVVCDQGLRNKQLETALGQISLVQRATVLNTLLSNVCGSFLTCCLANVCSFKAVMSVKITCSVKITRYLRSIQHCVNNRSQNKPCLMSIVIWKR